MPVTVGTGASLTFAGVQDGVTVGLTSISMSGMSRESIETTHLGISGGRTFLEGDLYDPGSIECEFILDDAPLTSVADVNVLLLLGAAGFTVTMDTGQGKWTGTAFATDLSWNFPLEELATGSVTLKITGSITTADT